MSVFRACSKRYGCPPAAGKPPRRPEHKCYAPWRAQVTVTSPGGKRRVTSRDCSTKREAQAAERDLRKDADRGIVRDRRRTVESWVAEWVDDICTARPSTKDGYRKHARLIASTIGAVPLDVLAPADIRAMHRELAKRGLSGTTVHHAHALLRTALKAAVEERLIDWSPVSVVGAPSMDVHHFQQPTAAEARAIMAGPRDARELARVAVAFLALRPPSEVLGLRWDDVHEAEGWLAVRQVARPVRGQGIVLMSPKTRRSSDPIPLPAWTASALAVWRAESGGIGFLFPGPDPETVMRPEMDNGWWHEYLAHCGVRPNLPRYGIRGAVASDLLRRGVDPRTLADTLRHARVSTSYEHYAQAGRPEVLAALESVVGEDVSRATVPALDG